MNIAAKSQFPVSLKQDGSASLATWHVQIPGKTITELSLRPLRDWRRPRGRPRRLPPGWGGLMPMYSRQTSVSTQLGGSPTIMFSDDVSSTRQHSIGAWRIEGAESTRMWANAQCDGCPAKYRGHPLFNGAKFGWRPLLECRAVMLLRHKTHWNLQGCPKLANGSQPWVGRSSPYCGDMWRRYCCLNFFFDCQYVPSLRRYSRTKLCDGAKMAIFCVLHFQWAACSTFQNCILNSH